MSSPSSATATVGEIMHPGVIDCAPQTTMRDVAALMAKHRVHCVVVDGLSGRPGATERLVWGIVSDVDLMRAATAEQLDAEAGDFAITDIVAIEPQADVARAAQLMGEHDCSHLVVVPDGGRPAGVVSSLDVARAVAGA